MTTIRPAEVAADPSTTGRSANLLLDYRDQLLRAIRESVDDPAPVREPGRFSPGYALPEPGEDTRRYFAAAVAHWCDLGAVDGHRLTLLDLTANPGTHTTKTFASLVIVARAVEYIRRTGEPVLIFSPTSANKGTALRDAVLRALDAGLATPEQLRIATLVPRTSCDKLRSCRLATDPRLRTLNPVLLYTGAVAEDVKTVGHRFVDQYAAQLRTRHGLNVWYSLDLRNYLVADTARAFFEHAVDPIERAARPRLHAHAVSSAFGLLGYHQGRAVLEGAGAADPAWRPASLLVQHHGTPDMVLSQRYGSFDRSNAPDYVRDETTGLYRQDTDPHFPFTTFDPDELLDSTFYTHQPATSPAMNALIERYGGTGVVVSLHECLGRYAQIQALLADLPRPLPADPRTLREWSVVMAMTGVLNAIERTLIDADRDVVVHGSGWYSAADYQPWEPSAGIEIQTVADIAAAMPV